MSPRFAIPAFAAMQLGGWGCYGTFSTAEERGNADTDAADPLDDDLEQGDSDIADEGPEPAAYWSVDGSLTLLNGQPALKVSGLEIGLWNAKGAPLCSLPVTLTTVDEGSAPSEPVMYGWWSVGVQQEVDTADTAGEADDCGGEPPTSFSFGFGPMDERLDSAMSAHDFDPEVVFAYGLYLQPDASEAPLYVFGIAGTEAELDGTDTAPEQSPPPDGIYELHSLYLLPLSI